MKIEILLLKKTLLKLDYFKLVHKKNSFQEIIIRKENIKFIKLNSKNILEKELIIRIMFKMLKIEYLFILNNIFLKKNEIILHGHLKLMFNNYEQGYVDMFKLIEKTKVIKWYELTKKQKYYYLRCCFYINGVKNIILPQKSLIIIDLSNVKIELDVYFEIGRAFFKSYGYFGTDIDSFIDCLCNIDSIFRKNQLLPAIKIKGHDNFKNNLLNSIIYKNLYKELKKSGFLVLIDTDLIPAAHSDTLS